MIKTHMKTAIITAVICAAITAGCTGTASKTDAAAAAGTTPAPAVDLRGKWILENIVINDSTYVRPAEETPDRMPYITFDDSTYHIATNCNSISGPYVIKGDSITLGDGIMTEMACDNMTTEDMLRQVLPHIGLVDITNDSTARLDSPTSSEYIVIRKAR